MRRRKLIISTGLFLTAWFVLSNVAPNAILGLVLLTAFTIPFLILLIYPVLYLNSVFLYFLAALPAWLLLRRTPRNRVAIAAAAGLVPLVAFGIPYGSELAAAARERQLRAADFAATFDAPPRSVEMIEPLNGSPWNDPLRNSPCTAPCQLLLLTGRVETVRVTHTFMRDDKSTRQLDYVLERQQTCPRAFSSPYDMVPQAREAAAAGRCIVAKAADQRALEARIVITEVDGTRYFANLVEDLAAGVYAPRLMTLEIVDLRTGAATPRLRQTEADLSWWGMPLALVHASCGAMCAGPPVFRRVERMDHHIDVATLALRTFGLGVGGNPSD
jgi:hypothetical protein